jgi:hypothetical protein
LNTSAPSDNGLDVVVKKKTSWKLGNWEEYMKQFGKYDARN